MVCKGVGAGEGVLQSGICGAEGCSTWEEVATSARIKESFNFLPSLVRPLAILLCIVAYITVQSMSSFSTSFCNRQPQHHHR